MSKLTDKIEALIATTGDTETLLDLQSILVDVRELERNVHECDAEWVVEDSKGNVVDDVVDIDTLIETRIRQAKREAYEHALELMGDNGSAGMCDIAAVIDVLGAEDNSDD